MNIKLTHTINNEVPKIGEVFLYQQYSYLRIKEYQGTNTLCLDTNILCQLNYGKLCYNEVKIIKGSFVEDEE